MIDVFKKYSAAGLACLPTKADKSPNHNSWKGGVMEESAYSGSPGIGIVCGEASKGLECLDFDNHFGDAKENISAFFAIEEVKEIGNKHPLVIEATMSGGYHVLYRCDTVGGNQKLARKPKQAGNGRWVPDVIIETRGEGGYFVAAPSPGYTVLRGDLLSIPYVDPIERDILITAAKSFNTWHEVSKTVEESTGDRPGDLFNDSPGSVDEMRSCLQRAGWTELRDGLWRRPGKKDGISATLGRVAPGVFYNFSSNGYPFESEKAYTAFQVISLLDYNGDFSAFARDLAETNNIGKKDYKVEPKKKETKALSELDGIMMDALIDTNIPIEKPPIIMKVRQQVMEHGSMRDYDSRTFTLGNFSAITGKGKSKKTFLASMFLAVASSPGELYNKLVADIPEGKKHTILFDTEQSRYDAYITSLRIPKIACADTPNFRAFSLREYSPMERCDIIEHVLKKYNGTAGFIMIDGIADLAKAINDEEEATRVSGLLLRWTKEYNCHICTIIHQNKNDNYATGHLGSSIIKKAECVITVEKDDSDRLVSHVRCDLIRGAADFDDFSFEINDHGIPVIQQTHGYFNKETQGF